MLNLVPTKLKIIGVSLSEPHIEDTARNLSVCLFVCVHHPYIYPYMMQYSIV